MYRSTIAVLICLAGLPLLAADEDAPQEDLELRKDYAAIEGIWQRQYRDETGRELTVTKSEHRGTSIVTVKDDQGKVLHSHQSEYELQRTGEVRIFKYWNRTVTAGPDAGRIDPQPRRYVYRVADDLLYEIHGVLIDEQSRPTIFVWKRILGDDAVTSL